MSIEENGQPAGQPMTEDAAANLIAGTFGDDDDNSSDDTPNDPPPEQEVTDDGEPVDDGFDAEVASATEGEEEVSDEDDDQSEETPAGDDETSEEPEYYDIDKLSPDMPFRLRDGTEYRWGDIKRGLAELQELPRQREEFQGQVSQFRQQQAQTAQRAQLLEQYLPLAVEVLKTSLPEVPPLPDPQLASQDVLAYNQQLAAHLAGKAARDEQTGKLQHLVEAQRRQQADGQQQTQAGLREYVQNEAKALQNAMPDLRDPQRAKQFYGEFIDIGQKYGFDPQELSQTRDHRLMLMARDLLAFHKAKSEKPKAVQKAKDAPPVKAPGKRKSDAEQKASQYREGMQRLRKTGSQDDAAALILNHLL